MPTVLPHSKALLPYSGLVVCLMMGCVGGSSYGTFHNSYATPGLR